MPPLAPATNCIQLRRLERYYGWRDQLLEAGRERLAGKEERQGERELRRKIAELERTLGKKTYELEIAGKALAGWE
jgi:transposase